LVSERYRKERGDVVNGLSSHFGASDKEVEEFIDRLVFLVELPDEEKCEREVEEMIREMVKERVGIDEYREVVRSVEDEFRQWKVGEKYVSKHWTYDNASRQW